jgi:hypothetical protein
MNIFDFITQEEIDDLPDDNPQAAFVTFVRIAQRRLGERTSTIDANDRSGWEELQEARHGFMNVAIAAAKKFGIEPFASIEVPRLNEFDSDTHRQFRADLDHYMTQLLLDSSSRARRDSVFISQDLKATIRTYIHHLRDVIEKANDLGEAKREILLRRLEEFEDELGRKRLNLLAVTLLVITFASAPGGIWSSAEVANKLLGNILRVVGDAKTADDATRRLPSWETPLAISGPRPRDPSLVKPKAGKRGLDDDIPF